MNLLAYTTEDITSIIILAGAVLLGLVYGLPAIMERRGSLWKDLAEERGFALEKLHGQFDDIQIELSEAKDQIRNLGLKTDLSLLQEGIIKEREQGVLIMQAELAKLQKATFDAETRIISIYENHEERAQERQEKILNALESLTTKIQNGH